MRKTISLLMIFTLLITIGSISFAENSSSSYIHDYGLQPIQLNDIPKNIKPIIVSNEFELKSILKKINDTPLGITVNENDDRQLKSRISLMSIAEKEQDVQVSVLRSAYNQNVYATIVYDSTTDEILSVDNIDTDITGLTTGVSYKHKSSFTDIDYSSSRKTVTVEAGGHFTYYILVEGTPFQWEDNKGIQFKWSVDEGNHSEKSIDL